MVPRSSFLLLSAVLLTVVAGLKSGGVRLEDMRHAFRAESQADIAALKEDMTAVRTRAQWAPRALQLVLEETAADIRAFEVETIFEARLAARRISAMLRTS